jgi:hypothetical protein
MRRPCRVAAVLALCALGGCTNTPACRYWSDAPIGKGLIDESEVPMLPNNPFWVEKGASGAPTPQDPCAGEPGHPATSQN